MDTRKIRAFLTAVNSGSLTAAAEALGYTQSGMTHIMNSLESELGLTLLIRSKSGVRLSDAGRELLPAMEALLRAADDFDDAAAALRGSAHSTLRVGAYSSIALQWVPEILAAYRSYCPDIQVSLTTNGMKNLYDAVRSGELDCAMVSYQQRLCQGLEWQALRNDELLAILPESMAYPEGVFPAGDFEKTEFYMPSYDFELDIMPALTADGGNPPERIYRTNLDDAPIVSMVEHGLGVSVMSRLIMQSMTYRVQALPLSPPAFRQLGIAFCPHGKKDAGIRSLISCAKTVVIRKYQDRIFV